MKRPFSFTQNHNHKPAFTHISLLGLACFFLFFSLGCSLLNRDSSETAPAEGEAPPVQQIVLLCSEECMARRQCGHLVNGSQAVVLGRADRPDVQDPQLIFPTDTPLPVLGVQYEVVQSVATGEQFNHPFYLIQRPDSQTGWAPGWCTNAP